MLYNVDKEGNKMIKTNFILAVSSLFAGLITLILVFVPKSAGDETIFFIIGILTFYLAISYIVMIVISIRLYAKIKKGGKVT